MIDKLENIGFYTLCNKRAKEASLYSPMWRAELLITDQCNFKCSYCRGVRKECRGNIDLQHALNIIRIWSKDGLKNIRFSGGEPTIHPDLVEMVQYSKKMNIERIALSTNGSANKNKYDELLLAGVNDFSISLDACCSSYADKMAGVDGYFNTIVKNIKYLSYRTYVTVGVVFTDDTIDSVLDIIKFAYSLNVSDIRIISAAQNNDAYLKFSKSIAKLDSKILNKYPILSYRISNIKNGRSVRGIKNTDSHQCGLLYDDSIIAGDYHFPCIIHFREGGDPIGRVGENMREERVEWLKNHDTHQDPICLKNCLDVCVDYNNIFEKYKNKKCTVKI
jgi:molybdenum cofactor biosynthesis enzyme MoaA